MIAQKMAAATDTVIARTHTHTHTADVTITVPRPVLTEWPSLRARPRPRSLPPAPVSLDFETDNALAAIDSRCTSLARSRGWVNLAFGKSVISDQCLDSCLL